MDGGDGAGQLHGGVQQVAMASCRQGSPDSQTTVLSSLRASTLQEVGGGARSPQPHLPRNQLALLRTGPNTVTKL